MTRSLLSTGSLLLTCYCHVVYADLILLHLDRANQTLRFGPPILHVYIFMIYVRHLRQYARMLRLIATLGVFLFIYRTITELHLIAPVLINISGIESVYRIISDVVTSEASRSLEVVPVGTCGFSIIIINKQNQSKNH